MTVRRESFSDSLALVIGIGNPACGDDGIGPLLASALREQSRVQVTTCTGDVLSLIDLWRDAATAILVDAAESVGMPGLIHRLDISAVDPPYGVSHASTHGFGVAEAIYLGRVLGRLPRRIVIFTVEGTRFAPGSAMTREVEGALDELCARVSAELNSR